MVDTLGGNYRSGTMCNAILFQLLEDMLNVSLLSLA